MFVVWVLSGSTFSELLSKQRKRKLFQRSLALSCQMRTGEGSKAWKLKLVAFEIRLHNWTSKLLSYEQLSWNCTNLSLLFYFPLKVPLLKLFIFKQSLTNCFPNTLSAINLLSIKSNQYAFPTHIHAFNMSCKKGISTPICCRMYLSGKPWKKIVVVQNSKRHPATHSLQVLRTLKMQEIFVYIFHEHIFML